MSNYLYLTSVGSHTYYGNYADYYESEKLVPSGKLKKDYFQEIQMMPYSEDNKYKVVGAGACTNEEDESTNTTSINLNGELVAKVTRTSDTDATLDILGDFDRVIVHPDWEIQKLDVFIKGKLKYIIENHDKLCSRYLFAFMTSSNENFFTIDSSGKDSVTSV